MSDDLLNECDVLVIGSGATGLLAAVRLHDLKLKPLVVEKSDRYGGTSAVSGGGIWVPNNHDLEADTEQLALTYLKACIGEEADESRLRAFIADAPRMARYLHEHAGVPLASINAFPDYFSRLPGAIVGRAMAPIDMDGKLLGEHYFKLRDSYSYLKLFGRLSINNAEAGMIGAKAPGWVALLIRRLCAYWLDFIWRRRTPRDRRLSNGQALVGGLRKAMLDRGIPLVLGTRLIELIQQEGRVVGAVVERNGHRRDIVARRGVILATGGFEGNQLMRRHHLAHVGDHHHSAAPRGINVGEGIQAGQAIGAAIEGMGLVWKAPVVRVPVSSESNVDFAMPLFWDRSAPGSLCVNRKAQRFVDEAVSYDQFGAAMLEDHAASGANLPCWMIFDASCRRRSLIGPLVPGEITPDNKLPPEWADSLYHRADSIESLAERIELDPQELNKTIQTFNEDARLGVDRQFDRGGCPYDQYFSNPKIKPNGSLAPLDKAPFYAVRLDLGDIGTKGGLKTDAAARVLDQRGGVIPGLYAAGNTAASIFINAYPGAGGTLAPALTQAVVAAENIAGV